MRIDLHTHSRASDGTDDPGAIPVLAMNAGIDVVGLTDHDTVAGWEAAENVVRENRSHKSMPREVTAMHGRDLPASAALVRGIELTAHYPVDPAQHPAGKSRVGVHILGYLFNPASPNIASHIEAMREVRYGRAREIVERLSVDYPISWELVCQDMEPGVPVGRPHIADTLVELGAARDRSAVFQTILGNNSPYYVPTPSPLASDAVEWIVAAGGKAVLAHPKAHARANFLPDSSIRDLAQAGLFGVEVNHRDNPRELRPSLELLARELGLAQFGSSDYHGTGKPNRMGENTTSEKVFAQLIADTFLSVVTPETA